MHPSATISFRQPRLWICRLCIMPAHRRSADCVPRELAATSGGALRPFTNMLRLFQGLRHALGQPEVQGAAQLALSLILIATIFYWLVEGWSLLDAVYFSVVTIATVGYGDLSPHTTLGKLFTIGYIVSGIGIFVAAITALA